MFVANKSHEIPLLTAMSNGRERHFSVIELSTRFPWFFVNTVTRDGPDSFLCSYCCAWEKELLQLCRPSADRVVLSVQQLSPSGGNGRWGFREISRVWQAEHAAGIEIAVLEDEAGQIFSGGFGAAPPVDLRNQTLIFVASDQVEKRRRKRAPTAKLANPLLHVGPPHPLHPVSAAELAKLLGHNEQFVLRLEEAGELFSVADAHPGRLFPMFQAWSGLNPAFMGHVLRALRCHRADLPPLEFFSQEDPQLQMLMPAEVLVGKIFFDRPLDAGAIEILLDGPDRRYSYVVAAAQSYATDSPTN